jgi:Ca2+-binding EF-hand superfamily protein
MEAIKKLELDFKQEEVEAMFREVDFIGNNRINYSEFLSATLSC